MPHSSVIIAVATAILAATPAHSDQLVLSAGSRFDGQIESNSDAAPSEVAIRSKLGRLVLDRDRVASVAAETPAEAEYRRRAPSVSDSVEAQLALAFWCRDNGVAEGMRRHLRRVLDLDPDHEEARMLLGYQNVDGHWMTREDVLKSRGLVRWRGEYRTPQEVAILKAEQEQEAQAIAWRRQIQQLRIDLDSLDRDTSRAAEEALANLSDVAAMPELLDLLAKETAPAIRRRLIGAIAQLGTTSGLGALAQIALVDPDPEVRAEAVDRLAADGSPGLAIPFIAALRSDNPAVINNAGWALGRLGSESTLEPLIEALVTNHSRRVGNDSGADTYSMTFGQGQGTTGFGGGGPRIEKRTSRNAQVLEALVRLTEVNFLYDKERWRAWLASRQTAERVNLRRDP